MITEHYREEDSGRCVDRMEKKNRKSSMDDDIIQNTMFICSNLSIFTLSLFQHVIRTIQTVMTVTDVSFLSSLQSDNNNGLCQCEMLCVLRVQSASSQYMFYLYTTWIE